MKRIVFAAMLVMTAAAAGAQSCFEIVLPYYNGDTNLVNSLVEQKLEYRCQYARNAFYWSDSVPSGAVVRSLADVVDRANGAVLSAQDITTVVPNYYAYTFAELQRSYTSTDVVLCFATPNAEKPYLVLRSLFETYLRTEFPENYEQ